MGREAIFKKKKTLITENFKIHKSGEKSSPTPMFLLPSCSHHPCVVAKFVCLPHFSPQGSPS